MALTTAGDLVRGALGKILVLGTQDTLASADLETGMDVLNSLLDSWWLESLGVYAVQQQSFATTSGVASYTIGPGQTWNTTRPNRIVSGVASFQGVDYPVNAIDRAQYDRIPYKQTSGIPMVLFYDREYPTGTVYLYPGPSPSGITIKINTYQQIQSFANAADLIDLPPGYARMIVNNLAVELAPDFGRTVSNEILLAARESKAAVKRNNRQDVVAQYDGAILYGSNAYNVYSDTYR
jgi:hypothetical protein